MNKIIDKKIIIDDMLSLSTYYLSVMLNYNKQLNNIRKNKRINEETRKEQLANVSSARDYYTKKYYRINEYIETLKQEKNIKIELI